MREAPLTSDLNRINSRLVHRMRQSRAGRTASSRFQSFPQPPPYNRSLSQSKSKWFAAEMSINVIISLWRTPIGICHSVGITVFSCLNKKVESLETNHSTQHVTRQRSPSIPRPFGSSRTSRQPLFRRAWINPTRSPPLSVPRPLLSWQDP
ncbi:hypothetical protein C8R43DRAFT_75958 [Mycena crocata]|nr:hypothetical protein C8R43DRAFT_75958 [Mycena crocata]